MLARALGLGVALALLLRVTGLMDDLRGALIICITFSVLMWAGFRLLSPWFALRLQDQNTPGRAALGSLLRLLVIYTLLLVSAVGLVRLLTGLNLVAHPSMAIFTFLIGLTVTAIMNGLHTTEHLVRAERARAESELEAMRLQVLQADHARKTQELEEARQLQLSMLPQTPPECCGMAFAHRLITATEVGGDTYDHRSLPDGSLLMAFGDATGHGLQAGLIVTAVKALFQTLPPHLSLPQGLQAISEGVRSLHLPRMAMALTLLRLDGDDVSFAAAGMPPLLHYRALENRVEVHRTVGPPVGQLKHFDYVLGQLRLAPGDALLLCSDGFPECLDPTGRMLGYDRLKPLFQAHGQASGEALIEAFLQEAAAWASGRPWADDLSFMVIQKSGVAS